MSNSKQDLDIRNISNKLEFIEELIYKNEKVKVENSIEIRKPKIISVNIN